MQNIDNLFFFEHDDSFYQFLNRFNSDTDLAVALTPQAAWTLRRHGIPHKSLIDYYTFDEFLRLIQEHFIIREYQLDAFDECLKRVDGRFREKNLPIFHLMWPRLCFALDVPKTYIFLLSKLFSSEHTANVKVLIDGEVPLDKCRYDYSAKEPLIFTIVKLLQPCFGYQIEKIPYKSRQQKSYHYDLEISTRYVLFNIKNFVKHRYFRANLLAAINKKFAIIRKLTSRSFKKNSSLTLLSVNCFELEPIRNQLEVSGWEIEDFNFKKFAVIDTTPYALADQLKNAIKDDENLNSMFNYIGVNYLPLVMQKMQLFISYLESYLYLYERLKSFLLYRRFQILSFRSLSSLSSPEEPLLAYICHKLRIPYMCWMHGGLGAYDISPVSVDLPFAHHYFVYGEIVKKTLEKIQPDVKMHVAGSPLIENFCRYYRMPKNKKKILVCLPHADLHNKLTLRNSYPNFHFSYSHIINRILVSLIPYQNRYKIIVKMNGEDYRLFYEKIKKDIGANFSLIGRENRFEYLLNEVDLVILTWVSTSFWQAACTKADIFLIDEGKLTSEAEIAIHKRAFYYRDIEVFLNQLQVYLSRGIFYQKTDGAFLSSYSDVESSGYRAEKIDKLLRTIIKNPDFRKQWGSVQKY